MNEWTNRWEHREYDWAQSGMAVVNRNFDRWKQFPLIRGNIGWKAFEDYLSFDEIASVIHSFACYNYLQHRFFIRNLYKHDSKSFGYGTFYCVHNIKTLEIWGWRQIATVVSEMVLFDII